MTTDNTPATLATAKHGGCVQLPNSERERFEAWAKHRVSSMARAADGEYVSSFTHALWCAWQAALSARQPVGEPVADWSKRGGKPTDWRNELLTLAEHHAPIPAFARSAMRVIARSMPAPTAQAVDLGPVRSALQAAAALCDCCASVDGYSRSELNAFGQNMRSQFTDALALIDGQAVGNG